MEIVSAITRRQRGRSLSVAQGAAILGHFRRHLVQRYNILELTSSLLIDAMTMARKHGLRAYDAVQLAAMIEANRFHHAAGSGLVTMISADHELNTAPSRGVDGRRPELASMKKTDIFPRLPSAARITIIRG